MGLRGAATCERRFDIVVAGDPAVASTLSAVCTVVPEGVDPAALREEGRMQQCFFFPYPDRSAEQYGFFGINQVHVANALSHRPPTRHTPDHAPTPPPLPTPPLNDTGGVPAGRPHRRLAGHVRSGAQVGL